MKKLLDHYLTFHAASTKASSVQTYRWAMSCFVDYFAGRPIEQITVNDLAQWMADAKEEGLGGRTIKYKLKLLRRIMQFALEEGSISLNPVQFHRLPVIKIKLCAKMPFTYDQYQRIVREVEYETRYHLFWKPACQIAWHTGLRMSDVAGLKRTGLNFDDGIVVVQTKKKENVGEQLEIPMEPEIRPVLLTLLNNTPYPDNPFVVPDFQANYARRRSWAVGVFGKACGRIGLPSHTFHSFRHGFVTRLINAGVDATIIQSMTGQTLDQILEYAHVSNQAKLEALAKSRQRSEEQATQEIAVL